MARREVTITWLQMTDADRLRPARAVSETELRVREVPSTVELSSELYRSVGDEWGWYDRHGWSRADWRDWIREQGIRTWLAVHGDERVGYFQLAFTESAADEAPDVEIAYFGLHEDWFGRGWGGWLLTLAVRAAWDCGAGRIWLHTCTLDHPAALANYRARGFEVYDRRTELREIRGARENHISSRHPRLGQTSRE